MFFKKLILAGISLLALSGVVSASYETFIDSLSAINVDAQAIENASVVSRNDLAELLSYVDCHDCHRPGSDLVSRLTSFRWDSFRLSPAVNFDDVTYSTSLSATNNYYCAAYVAEQGYMAGYPRQTSPLCSGKFCGTNNTTVADFIQVVINILADRIAAHYQVDWKQVEQWMDESVNKQIVQRYMTLSEQGLVRREALSCANGSCSLNSAEEFNVYMKYCTFNLNACGMQEWDSTKENFWPVAELNVLVLEGIVTESEANDINVNDYVDGKTVLKSLSQVKEKVACEFSSDKDYDQLKDYADSCYLHYNPSQKDTDNDGVGDVCDDDIDGDAVKNPVAIVDDRGNINTHALDTFQGILDNCLFVPNTDQADVNKTGVGDACAESTRFGLSIVTRKGGSNTYALAANYSGTLTDFAWDFGDGTYGQGRTMTHTFPGEGIYSVVLTAKGSGRTYLATTTISIAVSAKPTFGFQIIPTPLAAQAGVTIAFTPESSRTVGHIDWQTNGTGRRGTDGQRMSFIYNAGGTYLVIAKAYNNTQIVAYAQASVSFDGAVGSYLKASTLTPTVGTQLTFSTITAGIANKDIASIRWEFGDNVVRTNSSLSQPYTYSTVGPKIVKQTIYLLDGTELVNIINVDVAAADPIGDQGIDILPERLVMSTNQPTNYRFVLNGIDPQTIARSIIDMGDGQVRVFTGALQTGFNYTYLNSGIYRVTARVQKTDGLRFYPEAHITVTGAPICLQKSTLGGACDMDKDGVPDVCDDDINGDGTKNLLGLIVTQPASCSYTTTDLNNSVLAESIYLISQGAGLDKCPVSPNPDQTDKNGNFIGDGCESLIRLDSDRDVDGISDLKDACPDTPENYNGISDNDGCPDAIGVQPELAEAAIQPVCKSCPCPYVEDTADLKAGDKVRAVLLNGAGNIRIDTSSVHIVK